MPPSPRARRPSVTQAALQSLIDNPPAHNGADPAFSGRNWTQISVEELVNPEDCHFVEADMTIEDATNRLIECEAPSLLIRESAEQNSAIGTFDYADLNAYLLLVVGITKPDDEHAASLEELGRKARTGERILLREVKNLRPKEPLTTLPSNVSLTKAVEAFGGGVHSVVVVKENSSEVLGSFNQWRLVKFLWENARSFPVIEQLYPQYLRELGLGSQDVISINGDRPLCNALELMNNEGVSSVAVVDNQFNVVGNISVVDVKLLTQSTSLPLLRDTCIHFISVILSTRGLNEGKDSFPVFHVNPQSTLAHTVAKLVATRSHRMWVTDPQSPSSSGPSTPAHSSVHVPLSNQNNIVSGSTAGSTIGAQVSSPRLHSTSSSPSSPPLPQSALPHHPTPIAPSQSSPGIYPASLSSAIPASALPGARLSGRLVGVVSLTDILNLYARASGLKPADPSDIRSRRRRSSSCSVGVRKSGDIGREIWNRTGF
ncbi:cell separation during budding [Coccidioides posadasii str. Silveira]|uniref:Protein SDS23 n=2 Tax=Coccidioides posadasii (strain RMSCC 757 / Silveira) TaxID=443226 RepID=E9CZJ5_COCPS|nr:sds23 [Coccidioides posadasii str. Silveira]QVM08772.1 cell separation during budding [Coccidioides posadasii str. Silveira]